MGLNKEELNKVVAFVKAVKELPGNEEFITNLRKVVVDSTNDVPSTSTIIGVADEKIEHIYEYCIEDVLQRQAEEFYANFPVPELVPRLIEDFIRMERFRREDNFGDFSLAAYQQIEAIVNYVHKKLSALTFFDIIKDQPAFANNQIQDRKKLKDNEWTVEKYIKLRNALWLDKLRMVLYFVKDATISFDKVLNDIIGDIYVSRNDGTHREIELTAKQEERRDEILANKSVHYLIFESALYQFVNGIANGINEDNIGKVAKWAESLSGVEVRITHIYCSLISAEKTSDDDNKTYCSSDKCVIPSNLEIGDIVKVRIKDDKIIKILV